MLGLCPAQQLSFPIPSRRQFRSVSPPLPTIGQIRCQMANFGSSTRVHAFTTGALDGLQRDWARERQRQQQQQMVFRPKKQLAAMPGRVPSFSTPRQQPDQLAQQLCCLPSCAPGQEAEQSLHQFLRLFDDQRQMPVRMAENSSQRMDRRKLEWRVSPGQLCCADRQELIRQFAVGLPVEKQPYSLIAVQGLKELFSTPNGPTDVAHSLPFLIPQLRLALNSSQMWKKLEALEMLRDLAQLEGIGPKLVPYFRMLLPPLRIGTVRRANTDSLACQRDQLVNAVDRTLLVLEERGGPKAAINIKYLIPGYQPFFSSSFG